MWQYAFRRIATTVPVALIVAFIIFSLLYFAGGDPALVLGGDQASPQQIEAIRREFGLDRPMLERFVVWLGDLARGDMGTSLLTKQPVATLIGQRLEATLSLTFAALLLSVGLGLPLGILAARRPGSLMDKLVDAVSVLGFSMPVFVVAYALIYFLALELRWLPVTGFKSLSNGVGPFLRHITLPALALTPVFMGWIARVTRDAIAEVLAQDYVRTARAKGASGARVIARHAMRNAAVPIVTVVGMTFASLVSGVVITETVFAIPGLGRLTVDAIGQRDYPVIQGVVLLMSVVYILVNLLVDLSYVRFDPRIRY